MLERSSQNSMRKKQAAITACEKRDAQRRRTSWRHARAMEEGRHDQTPAQVCGRKIRMQKCRRPSGCSRQPGCPKLRFGPVALRPRLASGVLFASPRRLLEESESIAMRLTKKRHEPNRRNPFPSRTRNSALSVNCRRIRCALFHSSKPHFQPIRQALAARHRTDYGD